MSLPIRILPIRITLYMVVRMCRFPSERAGEDITITTTVITTVDIAMRDIRDGIAGGIRGGIGKDVVF